MPEHLEQIRARLEAATPGPWRRDEYYQNTVMQHVSAYAYALVKGLMDGPDKAWPAVDHVAVDGATICITGNGSTSRQNATFIAHAPADVAALLAEVARLREAVESAAEFVRGLADESGCDAGNWDGGSVDACEHCQWHKMADGWTAVLEGTEL